MSVEKIERIIDDLKQGKFRWTPVRREYISKQPGSPRKRPLGLPTWRDKLVQEVMRNILEAYYEPQFSKHSHGYRPGRGCHTALQEIKKYWTGTKWFIELDIAKCFDTLDHQIMVDILSEKIHDQKFLKLVWSLLKAGYLEDWRYHRTYSGTPQGGVASPILSNIYLDKLDKYIGQVLVPQHTRGERRAQNREYKRISNRLAYHRQAGNKEVGQRLSKQLKQLPSKDPQDPEYRRLRYVRYADDALLEFIGPKHEAEAVKRQIGAFISHELRLDLSEEKTLVTHAQTEAARFLGYDIVTLKADDIHKKTINGIDKRNINGRIGLRVPKDVRENLCKRYMKRGKPIHRPELQYNHDYTIVAQYQAEYRGIVNYYTYAYNIGNLKKLRWIMETSLLKTLACKHKSTVAKMARKDKTTVQTEEGRALKSIEVRVEREGKGPLIARFGGIPLIRSEMAELDDDVPKPNWRRTELIERLLAEECELCGATDNIEVHHIRKLKDLDQPGRREKPQWVKIMAARKRKTLVVCHNCHVEIHNGEA